MADRPQPQATRQIAEANAGVRMRLPFADVEDFDDAVLAVEMVLGPVPRQVADPINR